VFTGLIEEVGTVRTLRLEGSTAVTEIEAQRMMDGLREGDSVAVNGTCLTVVRLNQQGFIAELSQETLARTSLGEMQPGCKVNLERPLLPTTRLGGHFVQGHVDGVGKIASIHSENGFAHYEFSFPSELRPYIVDKGSIAVDGISLTVARLSSHSFQVAIIPHTLANTNLRERRAGDSVNLECDILAKYVESLSKHRAESKNKPSLTFEYLKEQGY
jgi:riboflavin synthase